MFPSTLNRSGSPIPDSSASWNVVVVLNGELVTDRTPRRLITANLGIRHGVPSNTQVQFTSQFLDIREGTTRDQNDWKVPNYGLSTHTNSTKLNPKTGKLTVRLSRSLFICTLNCCAESQRIVGPFCLIRIRLMSFVYVNQYVLSVKLSSLRPEDANSLNARNTGSC